jgi:hypothetical protein
MPAAVSPQLEVGHVYRTEDLARWGANAPRLAKRLVRDGKLQRVRRGLFEVPRQSRFGHVPATDGQLMRAFLKNSPFVFTGPESWNALGLGSTAVFANQLVYNTKRSGTFELRGRRFVLRRTAFPEKQRLEWFVVDLFENAERAGVSRNDLVAGLTRALERGRFNRDELTRMAERYATKATRRLIASAFGSETTP